MKLTFIFVMNRRVVAQGPFTMVERCDCGAMYLTVGPVCMKLDPRALPEIRATLARAARAMSIELEGTAPEEAAEPGGAIGRDQEREETEETEGEGHAAPPGTGGPPCDVN